MQKRISVIKKKAWFELIERRLAQKVEKLPPLLGFIDIKEKEKIEKVLQTLNEILLKKSAELEKVLQFLKNPKTLIYLQGSALRKELDHPIPPQDIDLLLLTANEYLPKPIWLKKKFEIEKGEIRLDINIYRQQGYQLPLIGRSLPECIVGKLHYQKERLIFEQYCTYNPTFMTIVMKEKQIQMPAFFSEIPYFLNPYHAFLSKQKVYTKLSESIVNKNLDIADKVIEDILESVSHYSQWISPEEDLSIQKGIQSIKKNLTISNKITLLGKELSGIAEELRKIQEEEKEALVSELRMILKDLKKVRKNIKKMYTHIEKIIEKDLQEKKRREKTIVKQDPQITEKENHFFVQEAENSRSLEKQFVKERKNQKTETTTEKKLREWEELKASFSNPKAQDICPFLHQCKQITKTMGGLDPKDIAKSLLDLLKKIRPLLTEKTIKRFSQDDYEAYHDLLMLINKHYPEADLSPCLIPHELISLEDSLVGSCHKTKYLSMVLKWLVTQKPLGFEEGFIEILDKVISLNMKTNPLADKMLDLYFNPCLFDQGNDELNKRLWALFLKSMIPYMERSTVVDHKKIFPSIKWGLNHGYNEVFSYLIKFKKFIPYELLKPMLESVIEITPDTDEETLEKKSETVTLISLYITSRIAELAFKKIKPDMPFLDLIDGTLGYFKEFISKFSRHSLSSESQLSLYTIPIWEKIDASPTVSAAIVILKKKDTSNSSISGNEEKKIFNEVLHFLKIQSFNILKSMVLLMIGLLKDSLIKESKSALEKKLPRFLGMIEEFEELSRIEGEGIKSTSGIPESEFRTDLTKTVKEAEKNIYESPWFSLIRKIVFKETLLCIHLLFEKRNLAEVQEKIDIFFSKTLELSTKGFQFKTTQTVGLHYRSHILDEIYLLFRESFTVKPMANREHHLDIFLIFCHELLKVLEKTNMQIEDWYKAEKPKLKSEDEETQAMIALIKKHELPLVKSKMKLTSLEKKKLKKRESLDQEYKDKIELELQENAKKPNLLNGLHQEVLIALKFLQLLHHLNKTLAEEKIKESLERMAESFQTYMRKTQNMTYEIPYLDESNKKLHKEIENKLQKVCG